jgi:hypothetical protein
MYMKQHILAALREELTRWEELLATLSEEQISAAQPESGWAIKDEIAHLWGWQQRSVARLKAAQLDQEPVFPSWPAALDPEAEASTDQINAWIYESQRAQPWPAIHQQWRANFLRLLELAEPITERDMLDSGRYAWLEGHSLALVLIATYDHHHEHLEKLLDRMSAGA